MTLTLTTAALLTVLTIGLVAANGQQPTETSGHVCRKVTVDEMHKTVALSGYVFKKGKYETSAAYLARFDSEEFRKMFCFEIEVKPRLRYSPDEATFAVSSLAERSVLLGYRYALAPDLVVTETRIAYPTFRMKPSEAEKAEPHIVLRLQVTVLSQSQSDSKFEPKFTTLVHPDKIQVFDARDGRIIGTWSYQRVSGYKGIEVSQ